jgi:hypothetical protein
VIEGECIWKILFQWKKTGILSMEISWNFAQGPGAQVALFVLGSHSGHQLAFRTFFFLPGLVHRKAAGKRRGKERENKIKIKQSKKQKNKNRECGPET